MKKGDWILLASALLLAALPLLLLLPSSEAPAQAVVRQNGVAVRVLPLDQDATVEFTGPEGVNVVRVEGGAVSVIDADCPDGTCMRQGPISRTGEALACLPHRLTVEIVGTESGVDAVTR